MHWTERFHAMLGYADNQCSKLSYVKVVQRVTFQMLLVLSKFNVSSFKFKWSVVLFYLVQSSLVYSLLDNPMSDMLTFLL